MKAVRYGTPAWRRYREGLPRTSSPRPAVERAYALARTVNPDARGMTEEAKKILFGQGRRSKN